MDNRKRLFIIIMSVFTGTLISAGLFFLRRGGEIQKADMNSLVTNMIFALAIVIFIGVFIRNRDDKKK